MRLYHGSKKIVTMPICDHKSNISDYGEGFYATESEELAGEWSADDSKGGFINVYEFDTEDLRTLDLCSEDHDILEWLALLLDNRIIPLSSPDEAKTRDKLIHDHIPDTSGIDIIKGYRADNSLFSVCRYYLRGDISAEQLEHAVRNGNTGEEVLLCSEHALGQLEYVKSDISNGNIYYPKRMLRDLSFRRYLTDDNEWYLSSYPDIYLEDAMRCLGELLWYASLFDDRISEDQVLRMFIISGYASRFETGDPAVISGMSGAELFLKIMARCGETGFPEAVTDTVSDDDKAYFCGGMLAYYQWLSRMQFCEIINAMPYTRLSALYEDISGLDLNEACVIIDEKIRERRPSLTMLQAYRKRLGLSQKELAAYSGVNIRTLQQYEIGDKDINRAAADKVISLSRTLYCSPFELLEHSVI